jgi:hypothetical protein
MLGFPQKENEKIGSLDKQGQAFDLLFPIGCFLLAILK